MDTFIRWTVLGLAQALVGAAACSSSSTPAGSPSPQAPTASAESGQSFSVSLDQWSVAQATTGPPQGSVTFTVTNQGTIPHEFVVLRTKTSAANIPIERFEGEPNRINEDTAGTNVGETGDMEAGTARMVTIDLRPGHCVFLYNLPGHYHQDARRLTVG